MSGSRESSSYGRGAAILSVGIGATGLITFGVGRLWVRLEGWPWRDAIQRGLAPVSIGLILAGCLTMAKGALTGWITVAIAAGVFTILLRSRINPALLILGSSLIGLFAFSGT